VSEQIWYRHDGLDTPSLQPKDARAELAQSGWFPLSDEDVAALEQAAADAVAADEKAMTASATAAVKARAAAERAATEDAVKALAPEEAPTKSASRGKTSTKGNE
jgi:dTDP-4-amino-4,6-dideoxygalactose transaminase